MLREHDVVEVNASLVNDDTVTHDFQGTVIHIYSNNSVVCVEDQDNNLYDIEEEAVTKID